MAVKAHTNHAEIEFNKAFRAKYGRVGRSRSLMLLRSQLRPFWLAGFAEGVASERRAFAEGIKTKELKGETDG